MGFFQALYQAFYLAFYLAIHLAFYFSFWHLSGISPLTSPLTSFLAPLSSFLSPLAFLLSPFSFLQCPLSSAFLCLSPVRSVSSLLFLPLLSLHSALLSPLFLSPQPISFFSFLCPLFSLLCPVSSFLSAFLPKILAPHAVRKLNENPNIRDASGVKRICTQTGQPAKEHEQSWNLELTRS